MPAQAGIHFDFQSRRATSKWIDSPYPAARPPGHSLRECSLRHPALAVRLRGNDGKNHSAPQPQIKRGARRTPAPQVITGATRTRRDVVLVDYAARLAFAFSASVPNALMSCTAMSARTLRSTVMPAFFRPFIMRLYDRPN